MTLRMKIDIPPTDPFAVAYYENARILIEEKYPGYTFAGLEKHTFTSDPGRGRIVFFDKEGNELPPRKTPSYRIWIVPPEAVA